MPYSTNNDLPASVREHLPSEAQDTFRTAFNRAFAKHAEDEATVFRIAWGAVKRRFEKIGQDWVPKLR